MSHSVSEKDVSRIYSSDLTRLAVDAVVDTANNSLPGGSGLAAFGAGRENASGMDAIIYCCFREQDMILYRQLIQEICA